MGAEGHKPSALLFLGKGRPACLGSQTPPAYKFPTDTA